MAERALALRGVPAAGGSVVQWRRLLSGAIVFGVVALLDLGVLIGAFSLTAWLRHQAAVLWPTFFQAYVEHPHVLTLLIVGMSFWFLREGLYSFEWDSIEECRRLFKASSLAVLSLLALFHLLKLLPARSVLLLTWGFCVILFPISRLLARYLFGFMKIRVKSVLVFSPRPLPQEKLPFQRLTSYYELLGVVHTPRELRRLILIRRPTDVVIFADSADWRGFNQILTFARRHATSVKLVAEDLALGMVRTSVIGDFSALELRDEVLFTGSRIIKRALDIAGSTAALILLLPIFAIIALLIRLESRGPVIFSQQRVGRGRKLFRIYKFRSMYEDAEERLKALLDGHPDLKEEYEKYRKLKDDPRITGVGKWLRKFSLDELPQFWNVLKGEMSLVGPRPYLLHELKESLALRPYLQSIFRVPPGLTGYQQVYHRGVPFTDRVRIDHYAVRHWSLWMDISVLVRTVYVVLKGKGAY